jgi:predicted ribosomally synthesized peptide with SipW-like signal peptide
MEEKEKMRKIALLAGAIMLALAVSGFTYAFWTDRVEIVAEMTTGTFGWEMTLEGDWVWDDTKDITTHWSQLIDLDADQRPDKVIWVVEDLYPGVLAELLWDMHFYGSIPGHIEDVSVELRVTEADGTETTYDENNLPDWFYIMFRMRGTSGTIYGNWDPPDDLNLDGTTRKVTLAGLIDELEGSQWHQSESLGVTTWVALVEPGMNYGASGPPIPVVNEPPQGAVFRLEIGIDGIQYNAGANGPPPPP